MPRARLVRQRCGRVSDLLAVPKTLRPMLGNMRAQLALPVADLPARGRSGIVGQRQRLPALPLADLTLKRPLPLTSLIPARIVFRCNEFRCTRKIYR